MTALLLTIPLVAAAPVLKDFKKAPVKLDGAWVHTGSDINGLPVGGGRNEVWTFDGESLSIQGGAAGGMPAIPIKTDVKASPMAIEFVGDGNRLGVCEIKDGVLVICKSMAPGVWPANVDGGNGIVRWTFKRAEAKK